MTKVMYSLVGNLRHVSRCAISPAPLVIVCLSWTGMVAAATSNDAYGAAVNGSFIVANAAKTVDWPSHGLDYAETRYSKLTEINQTNVKRLGLAWSYDLESTRGVEATPLVVDGTMYVTAPWSIVHAIDIRTGKRIWSFDPKVPRSGGWKACCDVVNRGVAMYEGKIFVATLDARLIALDASNGERLWEQDIAADSKFHYTSTGAPRVYKGNVIVGIAGGELGVRGYVSSYSADTGEKRWRWFTVPGDPSQPYENASMKAAAKTWDPSGKFWESGGGGATWNAMAFDPSLNLLYIGTDNGSPWSAKKRSPAGGDNLYTCSIVALNIDTGQYVWHYQNTPADNWDFSAVSDIILADFSVNGKSRKVLMQAPKNGFYFLIDRVTGKFISAQNFVDVNWAKGYDKHGRPVEIPGLRRTDKPFEMVGAGPLGAHSWQSMSWNPTLGLAYIPAQVAPMTLSEDDAWVRYGSNVPGEVMSGAGWNTAELINPVPPKTKTFGQLIAWDPIRQRRAWSVDYKNPWNGGTLATAANLVFQGTADGFLVAYDGRSGEKLWSFVTGNGVMAAPITYEVDRRQYVSVAVGWGGTDGQIQKFTDSAPSGRVFTFALDAKASPPTVSADLPGQLISGIPYTLDEVRSGQALYVSNCLFCHGVPGLNRGGSVPNLGYAPTALIVNLEAIIFKGPFMDKGMPDFTGKLTNRDAAFIKAFIQGAVDSTRPAAQLPP